MQFSCRFNLAQWFVCDYNEVCSRGVAQSEARHVRDVEVAGSSPVAPTNCRIVACGAPLQAQDERDLHFAACRIRRLSTSSCERELRTAKRSGFYGISPIMNTGFLLSQE